MELTYVIKYVAEMDRAVAFYRDTLGLILKFQSPEWTEFATGPTTLALHVASPTNPAGSASIGFGAADAAKTYAELKARNVVFTRDPKHEHGVTLAVFVDVDGGEVSISGP